MAVLTWVVALLSAGCSNPLAPSCTGESGAVASETGTVAAGQTIAIRLPYGAQGSQNDISLTWTAGRTVQFYLTRASCDDFSPTSPSGACQILGIAGGVVNSMTITHGQGNPEQLGTPPAYKVWIVGDPQHDTPFGITTTWARPIEC